MNPAGGRPNEKPFKVVACSHCSHTQVTAARRRFTCFSCGHQNIVGQAKILFAADSPEEARAALLRLKANRKT